MKNIIEKLLYKSLDAPLSSEETSLLNNELKNSSKLRAEYNKLKEIRNVLAESGVPDFKPYFEERLTDRLYSDQKKPAPFNALINSFSYSFREIAFAAIIILILLVTYNLKNGNIYSVENLFGKSGSSIEYAFDPIQNLIGSNNQ
jgi:hypothetical protein